MSENIETFGFENEEIKGAMFDKYKGKKGEVHRGAVIYTDPKALFAGAKIHYKDRYFLCKKGVCCEKCGQPKWRVGAVLIKYGTDKLGGIKKPFSYELFPWVFGEQTYVKLKNVNGEFPLTTHDIKIACSNEDFQTLDITPCNESIWTAKEEMKKQIIYEAKSIWESVKKSLGQDLSAEEINDLLGIATGVSTDPSATLDLDSVLDQI